MYLHLWISLDAFATCSLALDSGCLFKSYGLDVPLAQIKIKEIKMQRFFPFLSFSCEEDVYSDIRNIMW